MTAQSANCVVKHTVVVMYLVLIFIANEKSDNSFVKLFERKNRSFDVTINDSIEWIDTNQGHTVRRVSATAASRGEYFAKRLKLF